MSHSEPDMKNDNSRTRVLTEHELTIEKELGRRVSVRVFLVKSADGDPYVVKEIDCTDKKYLDKVKEEVKTLRSLNHAYIVRYEDFYEDEEAERLYVVMEYCEGGDLLERMQTQKKTNSFFDEEQILDWLVQICLALQYLHEKNVLYRDIKPQNVFLTEDGYTSLGIFGCSEALQRPDTCGESVMGGDLYDSPEALCKEYNYKSDIWSLAWLLHDLCELDVWSDIIKRYCLHALSMKGTLPPISERYSEELRELIRQMLSCDPEDRPSAEEILAKPFLKDAVNRNKSIPDVLQRKVMKSIETFDEAYTENYGKLEALVSEWGRITDSMESTHYSATAVSLSGSVIGATGGITALVGAALAPFTLGASLIVAGIGVGVGVAGGVTGAASNITDTIRQKTFSERLEQIEKDYKIASTQILNPLNTLIKLIKNVTKFTVFFNNSTFDTVQLSCRVGRSTLPFVSEVVTLCLLGNLGKISAQSAKMGRLAAMALKGAISALALVLDVTFMVKDSKEIHQMRKQWKTDDPEKVSSSMLKSIAQMRKTHNDLNDFLKKIKEIRQELNNIKEKVKKDKSLNI